MKSANIFKGTSGGTLVGLNREYINVAAKNDSSVLLSSKGLIGSRTAPSYGPMDPELRGRPNPLPPTQPNNHGPSFRDNLTERFLNPDMSQSIADTDIMSMPYDIDEGPERMSSSMEFGGTGNLLVTTKLRIGKPPLKLVSGSQFRNLPGKDFHRCENCEDLDRLNKKGKETVRSLRLQLQRLEDNYSGLKKTKGQFDVSGTSVGTKTADSQELQDAIHARDVLQRRCDDQEVEISRLRKNMQKDNSSLDVLNEKYNEVSEELRNIKGRAALDKKALNDENVELKSQVQKLNFSLVKVQDQFEKAEIKLKDCLRQLAMNKDKPDLTNEVEKLKKENSSLAEFNIHLNTETHKLNTIILELRKSLDILESSKGGDDDELRAKTKQVSDLLFEIEKHKSDYKDLENERKKSLDDNIALETLFQEKNDEISVLTKDKKYLSDDVNRLNAKVSDLMRKILAESEGIKKALELAISSSMRLCVVAPTVNVHVSDRKLKFKGSLSDKVLRDFLSTEVLGKYSFLFRQMEEDTAPDGSSLQDWIQKMLGDMQASIEQHINSAMEGGV